MAPCQPAAAAFAQRRAARSLSHIAGYNYGMCRLCEGGGEDAAPEHAAHASEACLAASACVRSFRTWLRSWRSIPNSRFRCTWVTSPRICSGVRWSRDPTQAFGRFHRHLDRDHEDRARRAGLAGLSGTQRYADHTRGADSAPYRRWPSIGRAERMEVTAAKPSWQCR